MKRDMDLVRYILMEVEKADAPLPFEHFIATDRTMDCVAYHIMMMEHHGLVDTTTFLADNDYYHASIKALTWDGCDYLDAIRSDSVWKKTKELISSAAGSTTVGVIKQVAELVVIQSVKQVAGIS